MRPNLELVLIVGLPGSGKSHLLEEFRSDGYQVIDDASLLSEDEVIDRVHSFVKFGFNVAIADQSLCSAKTREKATKMLASILTEEYALRWIFFENDLQACLDNVARRQASGDLRKVENLVRLRNARYTIPPEFIPRPVWRLQQ